MNVIYAKEILETLSIIYLKLIIFREEVYFCDSANVLFPIQLELQKIHYYAFL